MTHVETPREIQFEPALCPLCGSGEARPYRTGGDLLYGVPGEFRLVRCRRCRHVYMNPRPTRDTLALCYPEHYGPHQTDAEASAPTRPEEERPWYLSPWVRRIPGLRRLYYWLSDHKAHYVPDLAAPEKRALELGCGRGDFLVRLRDLGWSVQGVDLVEDAARRARARGLSVQTGTLEEAQFPDASFDAVFAWMVVEHLPDPQATLREVHRILKPGGWFAFSVPNFGCWERYVFGRHWFPLELPRHLQHFTTGSLRHLLRDTGFAPPAITHQATLLNVVGSVGLCGRRYFPGSRWPKRVLEYSGRPGMFGQLALAPAAKLLAALRQGGRLTVATRRLEDGHESSA